MDGDLESRKEDHIGMPQTDKRWSHMQKWREDVMKGDRSKVSKAKAKRMAT